ncbi:MAG: DUF1285 domain-containing protein [Alphaproteobacteria bacterium]|nr:DUF1285 domain-containing protein [Alphaproteobacteria bacterium]MBU0858925.1 DUF1285 domain-containing protein [Alphaproteobacteria bacterium]
MFRDYDHAEKRARGIGFTIDTKGLWYHHDGINPGPIRRQALAALFGGAGSGFMAGKGLQRDAEGYWLASPDGRYRVEVEDVPFVMTHMEAADGHIDLFTNFDERVEVGADHKLEMRLGPVGDEKVVYAQVRGDLWGRCSQAVHYELLATHAHEIAPGQYVIRSRGADFAL